MSEPIPTEVIRDVTIPNDVAVSPDGQTVAFVARQFDAEEDEAHTSLLTVPADGSDEPHRLTRIAGASSPTWSPDGGSLAFLATRERDVERRLGLKEPDTEEDDDADDNGAGADDEPEAQVWVFDLERGGDARQLTDRDHGVREFDWGPDGKRIVIAARDPTEEQEEYLERREDGGPVELERLQHKADGVGYLDDVTTYLFVVDIDTGDERRLDEATGAGPIEPLAGLHPAWHPSEDRIAFITCADERPDDSTVLDIFEVDVESGERTRLTDEGYLLDNPRWSPSGDRLVTSGRPAGNWYHPGHVFVVDPVDPAVRRLADGFEPTLVASAAPQFVTDSTILAGFGDHGHVGLYRLDVDEGEPTEVPGLLTREQSLRRFGVGGDTLAVTVEDPIDGHDIFALEGLRDTPSRLTDLNRPIIDEYPLPGFVRIESAGDETTIESMLYYPDSFDPDDPEPHPVLVWTHGGPMSFDAPAFKFEIAYFTSRGYVVCKPNYRGSTSYGANFAEVIRGRWGTDEVDDVLAVTEDLIERDVADPDRLFAMGLSYGGIMTGYLVTRSDRYAAAAAEHGIYDLRADFGTADKQAWMAQEFGLPWEASEVYDASSSILDVGGVDTPTLVTAGGEDWRCPPHQSEQFYVAIRKQGIPAKLVVYPDEHHAIGTPERAIHRLETIAEWFERHDPGKASD